MDVSLEYIGVGVNRVVNALAWSEHGGVAYAAHHMIALYDIKSAKVVSTICGHNGMVNCVHWVPREATPDLPPSQHILVSGASDNTVCCWLLTYPDSEVPTTTSASASASTSPATVYQQPSWRRLAVLQGHTAPVTSVAIHRLTTHSCRTAQQDGKGGDDAAVADTGPRLLLVSTAGDSDVLVWACGGGGDDSPPTPTSATNGVPGSPSETRPMGNRADWAMAPGGVERAPAVVEVEVEVADAKYGQSQWRLDQRIHVGTRMQTTAAMTELPQDPGWTLLATGGTDRKVHLYVRPPGDDGRFKPACVLEGHENWIRGVAFCCVANSGTDPEPQLLLASVSQDRYGRIWKLQPELPLNAPAATATAATATPGANGAGADSSVATPLDLAGSLTALIQRYAPKPHVDAGNARYVVTCEALLIGHEDWVHGLQWAPPPQSNLFPSPSPPATITTTAAAAAAAGDGAAEEVQAAGLEAAAAAARRRQPGRAYHTRSTLALLTASMDRTMIIWRYESDSGLWMNEASLGDAGASCLGYFGGVWGPGGTSILAHGFTGALHLWCHQPHSISLPVIDIGTDTAASDVANGNGNSGGGSVVGGGGGGGGGSWLPHHALGGHFGAVVDLSWALDGRCVISVSEDQTARVHTGVVWERVRQVVEKGRWDAGAGMPPAAPAPAGGLQQLEEEEGKEEAEGRRRRHWCEVARAQVHGHDFRCVAAVPTPPGGPYVYVSGSEEKVLRVLEAPQAFIDTLVALRGGEDSPGGQAIRMEGRRGHGFGAAIAALGLSNKAVDAGEGGAAGGGGGTDYTDGPDFVPCAVPQVVRQPPLEEHLAQNTLWPETHKLYGHGNDVFCAACSPDGRYLASACKAQTAATAAIWVWCTRSWRAVAQLRAHSLTVTQLEWSPSSTLLAAASRDRTFSIFRRRDVGEAATAPSEAAVAAAAEGGGGGDPAFELVCRLKGAHGRVIWSVSWSLDEQLLATASRDDTVKVWRTGRVAGGDDGDAAAAAGAAIAVAAPVLATTLPQFPCAATAVAFAPRLPSQSPVVTACSGRMGSSTSSGRSTAGGQGYVFAVGLEDGSVQVWQLATAAAAEQGPSGIVASCLWSACEPWRHVAAVRRLRWRGAPGTAAAVQEGNEAAATGLANGDGVMQLASGSEDHSVRVFTLRGV